MNDIHNIDAMEYLDNCEKNSFDLIVLDPNYEQWKEFINRGIIEKSMSLLKDSGNILCFTKQPFDYDLRIAVNDYFRREIVWTFENGGAWVSKKMPLVSFQKIFWLVKSDNFYFNPRTGLAYSDNTTDFQRSKKVFGGYEEKGHKFEKSSEGIWLRDHLHYNKPNCGAIPQKPKELIEIFIKCFCPPNGVVLDLFGGSGIVSVVAKENNINSESTEIDKDRVEIIKKNLNAPIQMSLFDCFGNESLTD